MCAFFFELDHKQISGTYILVSKVHDTRCKYPQNVERADHTAAVDEETSQKTERNKKARGRLLCFATLCVVRCVSGWLVDMKQEHTEEHATNARQENVKEHTDTLC